MLKLPLSGQWKMRRYQQQADWVSASVPGCVYNDLILNGLIPDPFLEDNENNVQWVAENDWLYSRTFEMTPEMLTAAHLELVCEGLDTLAEIKVNGRPVLSSSNMFISQRVDIKSLLRPGQNEISILLYSPLVYTQQKMAERFLPCVENGITGWAYLRKTASHYGWDWGPRLPTQGIWKDIYIQAWSDSRITDVFIRQQHYSGKVALAFAIHRQVETDLSRPIKTRVRVTCPDGTVLEQNRDMSADTFDLVPVYIHKPRLWWPNGYGDQPLYQAEISLLDGELVVDERRYVIGLRTIELRQEEDAWGQSFTFVVNGTPIFAKGSNWIPADSFLTRINHEQLEHLIRSAALANHNMLRVWGGGCYESDDFYALCDRYGILVWQDFMFSCAVYPLNNEDYLESIHEEVRQAARRLRQHACLALWCGNNELEMGWSGWGWDRPDTADLKLAHEFFFFQILPAWLMDDDPLTPYWPGSPSSGESLMQVNEDALGDTHLWQVWHELKPFKYYRERKSRFVSEFGFQSLPALQTIAAFAAPTEWNLTSYVMEHHQKNAAGNGKMLTYLTAQYRFPTDFKGMVYLTQIQQAEALRTGVEHWRRYCERTGGALYWQLNDCWPAVSWSSIDYNGRWKAAHYASRRFFAPLLISMDMDEDRKKVSLYATNERGSVQTGLLRWFLLSLDGDVLAGDEQVFMAMPAATTPLDVIDLSQKVNSGNQRQVVLAVEHWSNEQLLSRQVLPFVPDKHLVLKDPQISLNLVLNGEELELTLISESLARFVEVSLEGRDVIFSDNYFDLPARKPCCIKFASPAGMTLQEVRAAVKIYSLFDTFSAGL
ncbi:MAG: glycoside hydrolase family 2 protein [Anaerolineae bacterium]|nr:glycoside hydrolase family 2 protein [Anaerolineae bacterium]